MAPRTIARTRHLDELGAPRFTNRLAQATSTYLRQHMHNPVDWWPWGDAAFAEARRRDVPVFLSVGYATCHWCHVMEEESFDDEDIAALLNAHFVCVKVDREERPDVDAFAMAAVQALTGGGGWPASVWLTPQDRRPFFAGTYFPPHDGDRGVRLGFTSVLQRIQATWREARDTIVASADGLTRELVAQLRPPAPADVPGPGIADDVVAACAARFDVHHGGVGREPKFPSQTPLRLLLRHTAQTGRPAGQQMALSTLRAMLRGGFHDLIGGGFHRYSVDAQWHVPHFEKMLVDNALLVPALVEAWQVTGDDTFETAARATLAFIDDELSRDDGAFGAATDADSKTPSGSRAEGWFFTWTPEEVEVELGAAGFSAADIRVVCAAWDITAGGHLDGRSIPRWRFSPKETAARVARSVNDVLDLIGRARAVLRVARRERPAPLTDHKAIAAWNGYAISAFAFAGFAWSDDALVDRAVRAFDAVMRSHRAPDGRLWRTREASLATGASGTLDDHASLCRAALDLFEATGALRFLDAARDLDAVLARHFEDHDGGGFFRTAHDAEVLLVREKPDEDGAEPSGNSIHAENLVRLALLTDDDRHRRRADATLRAFGRRLQRAPLALTAMVAAIDLDEAGRELVIAVPDGAVDEEGQQLLDVLRRRYLPSRVLVWLRGDDGAVQAALPLTRGRASADRVRVFVCEGGACRMPVTTSRQLLETLGATPGATSAGR
jgi:uncharacterized protein YyaL (SSP411 family)